MEHSKPRTICFATFRHNDIHNTRGELNTKKLGARVWYSDKGKGLLIGCEMWKAFMNESMNEEIEKRAKHTTNSLMLKFAF